MQRARWRPAATPHTGRRYQSSWHQRQPSPVHPITTGSGTRQWWRDHQVDLGLPEYNARGAIPNQVKAAFRDNISQP